MSIPDQQTVRYRSPGNTPTRCISMSGQTTSRNTAILQSQKRKAQKHIDESIQKSSENLELLFVANFARLYEALQNVTPFDIYINAVSRTTLERMERNSVPLDSLGLLRTGIMGFDYWALENDIVDADESDDTNFVRIVTNSQVEPFRFIWGKKIRLYKDTFRNPRIDLRTELIGEGTRDFFQKKKIIMRGVARHTTAVWDGECYALLVAVHGFIPNDVDPYFLVGLFNSELFNWLHRIRFYAAKIPQGSLRYPVSFWRDLPIRIDRQDLIKEISGITRSLSSGKANDKESYLARLNDAVLRLYEISNKELA